MVRRSKGRKVLSHPFSRKTPKQVNKENQPKMSTSKQIHLGKGHVNKLNNVGDVREINCIGTTLTKEK
jgi:hypothetical protein